MNENLIIIGAGGHGKVCLDIALEMNRWKDIYFLDDYCQEKEILGHKVLGTTKLIESYKGNSDFFVGIGDNEIREKVYNKLIEKKLNITTLIHPQSVISRFSTIGEGSVVMPGVIINASTIIGISNIINTNASIDHDCVLHDFVQIAPNVSVAGGVEIGMSTYIGMNSAVINNIKIVDQVFVGASSLANKNIQSEGLYFGIPLKRQGITK